MIVSKTVTITGGAFGYNAGLGSVSASYNCDTGATDDSGTPINTPIYAPRPGIPLIVGATVGINVTRTGYKIVEGADSLIVTCTPTATVTTASGSQGVSVRFSASAVAAYIKPTGTTPFADTMNMLTGQQVKASIAGVSVVAGSHNWNVSGASPFKKYITGDDPATPATENIGKKFDIEDADKHNGTFFLFTADEGVATVTCSFKALVGGEEKTLNAELPLNSVKPESVFNVESVDDVYFDNAANPTSFGLFKIPRLPDGNFTTQGQKWVGAIRVDPPFSGGAGAFCQLIKPLILGYTFDPNEPPHGNANPNQWGLDNGFPYGIPPYQWNATTEEGNSGDSPQIGLRADFYKVSVTERFETWLMYKPPANGVGVSWVPMRIYSWNWAGTSEREADTATNQKTGKWILVSKQPAAQGPQSQKTSQFPEWELTHSNTN